MKLLRAKDKKIHSKKYTQTIREEKEPQKLKMMWPSHALKIIDHQKYASEKNLEGRDQGEDSK